MKCKHHVKGKQKEIIIKLGLSNHILLNKVCKSNQITIRDVFLIGLKECLQRGLIYES